MRDQVCTRDDVLSRALAQPAPERDALLMAGRFLPLRPLERIRLLAEAPGTEQLLKLDHYRVERIIGRPLRKTAWNPRQLLAETKLDLDWLSGGERWILWIGDAGYPAHLREIYDPPAVLYGWGNAREVQRRGIALVGTRQPDHEGEVAAFQAGYDLARRGIVCVSGLARGIDAAAHRGTVGAQGVAVAVLGSGIDAVYPAGNRPLGADILDQGGAIVSEYPPGAPPRRYQFPARNRIVVGLSAGVVVFQAPEPSGALISAEFGLQLGVEVMVHAVGAAWTGCRRLLQAGASLVENSEAVLELIGPGAVECRGEGLSPGTDLSPGDAAERAKLALFDLPGEVRP
ncbi:DNA processing protein [Alkalispirochaeta americana]|uniref:DNA processing protein n=1 Tax=Alkalispirochaeta americana TaxID=159291 RepID=A0A1N6PKG3_9SPIO|nr:DNA-processing protein DprA [Alkalispirochaeta americana]SIQ04878.1 DNA processing protein [Alkalispirochaeta americana]